MSLVVGKFGFLAVEMWNVMVSEREREVLCLCCAFSAVLSGCGHSFLPCEAENVSHEVIMTNPNLTPRPFFFILALSFPPPPPPCWPMPNSFLHPSAFIKQHLLFSPPLLNRDVTEDVQPSVTGWKSPCDCLGCQVTAMFMSACFLASVTAVESFVRSLLVRSVNILCMYSPELML